MFPFEVSGPRRPRMGGGPWGHILAAIIGFGELAKDHLPESNENKRYVDRVLQAGIWGRDLVRQMLQFSRQTEHEQKLFVLSRLIKETVKLLRASMPSNVSIKMSVKSESGLILGVPVQIQQVLMNLASNAAYLRGRRAGSST